MVPTKEGPGVSEEKLAEPFDRSIIKTLRETADKHADEPYSLVTMKINWLWFNRMVTTMEKSL